MNKLTGTLLSVVVCATLASADKVNTQFELPKDTSAFDKVEFDFKADLTFNYQMLDQSFQQGPVYKWWENPPGMAMDPQETELQNGLVLPTANLDIHAKVLSGFNVKLQTMLSSHNHHETFVKGGEVTIDNLDFISDGFGSAFMDYATIRIGVNDINFGDAHYRRTDNAAVFKNPFVHNMGVESYIQAGFLETLYRIPAVDMFVMGGITNQQVDPSDVEKSEFSSTVPAFYGKVGYDSQLNDAFRLRLSQSLYYSAGNGNNQLYNGDKAGTVSDKVFNYEGMQEWDKAFGSSWNAMDGYYDLTVSMTNVFLKYNNTEVFGLLEFADSSESLDTDWSSGSPVVALIEKDMKLAHYSIDVVQRFYGDKFYVGARYESATTEKEGDPTNDELTQYQLGAGWFISKNAIAKLEYISQERENMEEYVDGKAKFDGFMFSTALTF